MKKFYMIAMLMILINISHSDAVNLLNGIDVSTEGNITTTVINCNKPIQYTEGKLKENNRIYFDFKDTVIKSNFSIEVNENYIYKVRAAQNMIKPEYITRVVFDMKEMRNYKIELNSDKKQMKIIFTGDIVKAKEETREGDLTKKKIIVIDAGHGGKDPGAIFSAILEKGLNLDIAKRLGKLLTDKGYEVIFTRENDTFIELVGRAEIANKNNADLFIGIHNNSMPKGFFGSMTLYNGKDNNGSISNEDYAYIVQKRLEKLGIGKIGVRERNDLVVLKNVNAPAIIAEIACMSNKKDLKLLMKSSFRQKVAEQLFEAVDSIDIKDK